VVEDYDIRFISSAIFKVWAFLRLIVEKTVHITLGKKIKKAYECTKNGAKQNYLCYTTENKEVL
jgi:hypothetical protein